METSPLTLAHDHARCASVATQSSDTTVALNEHALAAGEFAKAATTTGSVEALRTLKLLESHHQKLAELLRYPVENPPNEVHPANEKPLSTSAAVAELRASKSDIGPRALSPLRNPPSLPSPRRLPPRDLSSSIASNLASARGIRANYTRQPLSPSISTQQAPGSLESLPRKKSKVPASIPEHPQPSWLPPSTSTQKKGETKALSPVQEPSTQPPAAANDEGFSRFYKTFENILSKLPAPLAFAGLPLVAEESDNPPQPEPSTNPRRRLPTSSDRRGSDPDLTKYISRAALRASTRDGQSANDSFYVVPTTGHTVSYAHILSFDEKQKRRMAASIHSENPDLFADPEEDDFVDARETPMPVSPTFSRQSSRIQKPSSKELENKVEELEMENASLKEVVDKLSKRLHQFEMSAQQNGRALQESMRIMRDMSPAREPSFQKQAEETTDDALKRRIVELENYVNAARKDMDRMERENEKLKSVVTRYRDRWEKLKEGAKTRREGNGGLSRKDGEAVGGRSPAL